MQILPALLVIGTSVALLFSGTKTRVLIYSFAILTFPLVYQIQLGQASLSPIRILTLVVLARSLGSNPNFKLTRNDILIFILSVLLMIGGFLNNDPSAGPIFTAGMILQLFGTYFAFRLLLRDKDHLHHAIKGILFGVVTITACMFGEVLLKKNLIYELFGFQKTVGIRDGKLRAQGPFLHPILAGTAIAMAIPLFHTLKEKNRYLYIIGLICSILAVGLSASSGPMLALLLCLIAVYLFKHTHFLKPIKWAFVAIYLLLEVAYTGPAYFQITRLDFTGSSTGWYRARLLQSSMEHLNEWWLHGTGYTRHWMPTGLSQYAHHSDITNYFLHFGVLGGLGSTLIVVALVVLSVRDLTKNQTEEAQPKWGLASMIIVFSIIAFSVSFFDQSSFLFWLPIAAASSLYNNNNQLKSIP